MAIFSHTAKEEEIFGRLDDFFEDMCAVSHEYLIFDSSKKNWCPNSKIGKSFFIPARFLFKKEAS